MLLSNYLDNVQCASELKNSVEKCYQNVLNRSIVMFRNQSNASQQFSNHKHSHNHRIRWKMNDYDNRQCDKMIRRKRKTTTTTRTAMMDASSSSTTRRETMTSTRPISSTLTTSSSLQRAMPLRISYTSIAVVMFFIIALHSQNANGALSRDSSSIYHNNSINNVIAVINNSTLTDDDTVDLMANVITNIDNGIDDQIDRNAVNADDISYNRFTNRKIRKPIYHNEFAVYIPNGETVADSVAAKHGFENSGQVRSSF